MGFAPEDIVIVAEINELQSNFCAVSSHCSVHTKTSLHLSVGASHLGKYSLLTTSFLIVVNYAEFNISLIVFTFTPLSDPS